MNNRIVFFLGVLLSFSASFHAMTPDEREQVRQSWLNRVEALQDEEQNADHKEEMPHSEDGSQGKMEAVDQECLICLDEKDEEYFNILECGHTFCTTCLSHIVDSAIREKSTAQLRCPNGECTVPMSEQDVKIITNDNRGVLDAIAAIRLQEWIAIQSNAKYCPTPDCKYVFLSDERCPQPIMCPECNHKYCSNCLSPHAVRMTCREAEAGRIVDKDSDEWKRVNTKPCPNCRTRIEKNGGCAWVQCTNCHLGFCYNCYGSHHDVGVCTLAAVHHEELETGPVEANPYAAEQDEMLRCEQVMRELQERQAANLARRRDRARRAGHAEQGPYVYYRDQHGPRQLRVAHFRDIQEFAAEIPQDRAYMWIRRRKGARQRINEAIILMPLGANIEEFIRVLNRLCHVHKKQGLTDCHKYTNQLPPNKPRRVRYTTDMHHEVFQDLFDQANRHIFE